MNLIRLFTSTLLLVPLSLIATPEMLNAIKEKSLKQYDFEITKEQQEQSKWVRSYFESLPDQVEKWPNSDFDYDSADADLRVVEKMFLEANGREIFIPESTNEKAAIVKYAYPIFWRVEVVFEYDEDLAAKLIIQYMAAVNSLNVVGKIDQSVSDQYFDLLMLNAREISDGILLRAVESKLENKNTLESPIHREILRERLLSKPDIFSSIILPIFNSLKQENIDDQLSVLTIDQIVKLEQLSSDFILPSRWKFLTPSFLSSILREGDIENFSSSNIFLLKHLAEKSSE